MESRVAQRYAKALFAAAQKVNAIAEVENDLNAITSALETDPKLADLVLSPRIRREDKAVIFKAVFDGRVHGLTFSLIQLLLQKRREEELGEVGKAYSNLRRDYDGVIHVVVSSASEMDETQKSALVEKVKTLTGKQLDPDFRVDSSLLGGVKVVFGNTVIDSTVRGNLEKMHDAFRYNLLKQA